MNILDFMNPQFRRQYIHAEYKNPKLISDIKKALLSGIENVESWKDHTVKLYDEKFSEKIWEKTFISLFD